MSQDKKVAAETKLTEEEKLFEEKKAVNPYIAGFIESMEKSNTEKTTKEILEGLSEDTGDSDSYDAESGGKDSEDRPWRPSHAIFEKSTIKQSHLENMRGRYFRDMSIVRAGGDNNVPNFPSSIDPRSHIEDGSLHLGSKKPRDRANRKMLL
jgi:hypothetical protein